MKRRDFLTLAAAPALPALAWAQEKSKLKITDIKIVKTRPRKPYPTYKPADGAWSTQFVEVANPMSIYPEFKPRRDLLDRKSTRLNSIHSSVSRMPSSA